MPAAEQPTENEPSSAPAGNGKKKGTKNKAAISRARSAKAVAEAEELSAPKAAETEPTTDDDAREKLNARVVVVDDPEKPNGSATLPTAPPLPPAAEEGVEGDKGGVVKEAAEANESEESEGVEGAAEAAETEEKKPRRPSKAELAAESALESFDAAVREEEARPDDPAVVSARFAEMKTTIASMAALVERATGLASLHSLHGLDGTNGEATATIFDDIDPAAPTLPLPPDGDLLKGRYVCLADGALLEPYDLLEGAYKGQPYVPLRAAEEQVRDALSIGVAELTSKMAGARALANEAARVGGTWQAWVAEAEGCVDAGFAQIESALQTQRAAAKLALVASKDRAEAQAAAATSRAQACWQASAQQMRAVDVYMSTAAMLPAGALASGWGALQADLEKMASRAEQAMSATSAAADEGESDSAETSADVCDAIGAAVASASISAAIADYHEIPDALRLVITPTPAALPAALLAPPQATSAFDAVAQLTLAAATFPGADGGAKGGAEGVGSEETLALLSAQRAAIEKLQRQLEEQSRATAILQSQLDGVQAELGAVRAHQSAPSHPLGAPPPPIAVGGAAASGLSSTAPGSVRTVYHKAGVKMDLSLYSEGDGGRLSVVASVSNATASPLGATQVMVAVPRYLQLHMASAAEQTIAPGSTGRWPLTLLHTAPAEEVEKPFKVKIRLQFAVGEARVVEEIVSGVLEPPPRGLSPTSSLRSHGGAGPPSQPNSPRSPRSPDPSSAVPAHAAAATTHSAPHVPRPSLAPPVPGASSAVKVAPPPVEGTTSSPPAPDTTPPVEDSWADFESAFDAAPLAAQPPPAEPPAAPPPALALAPPPPAINASPTPRASCVVPLSTLPGGGGVLSSLPGVAMARPNLRASISSVGSEVFDNTFGEEGQSDRLSDEARSARSNSGARSPPMRGPHPSSALRGGASTPPSVEASSRRESVASANTGPLLTSREQSRGVGREHGHESGEGDGLPKPAHLIKAEMGIVLQGERHVLLVSLADDLDAISSAWCAERGLQEKARAKIVGQLQTRLDAALAQAYAERDQPPALPSDVA